MRPARFFVDPEVSVAQTLDKAFYLDPAVYEQARHAVFARGWHWLGSLAPVAEPGSLAPHDLLPGLLDEAVLLARDAAGTLRCLSNVCTHRGMRLLDRPCQAEHIRCAYHGRRFELNGRLRFAPGFEGVQNFPAASDHLSELAFGDWAGHGFTALAPRWPLQTWLGDMPQRLGWLPIQTWTADTSRSRSFEFDAHWALYVENYLEGLHIPFVHAGLKQTLDMAHYGYELGPTSVLQLALARDGQAALTPPPGTLDHGLRVAAYYWWLFPNLMFNVYPWGMSVNVVQPLSPTRTRVLFRSFVAEPALLGQGAGGALDAVQLEDEAVVRGVQQGLRASLYRHGRYSATHERGLHHFHRLLCEALDD